MKIIKFIAITLLQCSSVLAQQFEECYTMQALEQLRKMDPLTDQRHAETELKMQQWVSEHPTGMIRKNFPVDPAKGISITAVKNENKSRLAIHDGQQKINSDVPCAYNNTYYETVPVPTIVNQSVVTQLYGGEFSTAQGFLPGSTYKISTCNSPGQFDSQITLYPAGGGAAQAWDDDGCGTQGGPSSLEFSVGAAGNLDILLDQYDCMDNFNTYMDVSITLLSTAGGGIDTGPGNPTTPAQLVIPVVVHILYKDASENHSDQRIQTQIDVLNRMFRKCNSDTTQLPSVFLPLSADFEIQFCLAKRDPNGQPTTGITRTVTSVDSFDANNDMTSMKFNSSGGKDNWNPNEYLNIWSADLGVTGPLGFSSFPDELAAHPELDGVVINSPIFGTGGSIQHYNLGRTCVHEVGHWLSLRHVWGDAQCGDDFVADTPTQETSNGACPTFPHITCSNGPNGDMYNNIMDYVWQDCRIMFSQGQKTRAWSAINTIRTQISSLPGCLPVGIDEVNFFGNYTVYPNPAHDELIIESTYPATPVAIEIYNTLGERIMTDNMNGDIKTINIRSLNSGIYVIALSNSKVRGYKKIIVN